MTTLQQTSREIEKTANEVARFNKPVVEAKIQNIMDRFCLTPEAVAEIVNGIITGKTGFQNLPEKHFIESTKTKLIKQLIAQQKGE